jgi:hypothetical protein
MKCKNCEHWKSEQAEMEYRKFVGMCTSPKLAFNSKTGASAYVLDRQNPNPTKGNKHLFEHIKTYLSVEAGNYCLVTSDDFGCINFEKKNK